MSSNTKNLNGGSAIDATSCEAIFSIWAAMVDSSQKYIEDMFTKETTDALIELKKTGNFNKLLRLLILLLKLRDIRNGGQGRRFETFIALIRVTSIIDDYSITKVMLQLLKHHGRWSDLDDIRKILENNSSKINLPISGRESSSGRGAGREIKKPKGFVNPLPSVDVSQFYRSETISLIYQIWADTIKNNKFTKDSAGAWKYLNTEGISKNINNTTLRVGVGKILFPTIIQNTTYKGVPITSNSQDRERWGMLLKALRKLLVDNRKKLHMLESYLCSDNADKIKPSSIPSVARLRFERALSNQSAHWTESQDQRSNNPKRIKCAQNFETHNIAVSNAASIKRMKLEELEEQLQNATDEDAEQIRITMQQVQDEYDKTAPKVHAETICIMNLVKQYIDEPKVNINKENLFNAIASELDWLNDYKVLVVCDTSGSMSEPFYGGVPKYVSIGLTALFSRSLPLALRNKFITFSKNPAIVDLSLLNDGNPTLFDFLTYYNTHTINDNTDLVKTIDCVAELLKLSNAKIDLLLIISDGQFDNMNVNGITFNAGEYCQEKLADTTICFWNVNGKLSPTFPAEVNKGGMVLMDGYNPKSLGTLMKTITNAPSIEERITETNKKEMINTLTVIETFCDSPFSYPLRKALNGITEGIFGTYLWDESVESVVESVDESVESVVESVDESDESVDSSVESLKESVDDLKESVDDLKESIDDLKESLDRLNINL